MDVVLLSICKGLIGKSLMGISSIKLNADETKFIITCKDGSEFTVNVPKGAGFTTNDIKSTLDVGAIKNGEIVSSGTNLQEFAEMLLIQDEAPSTLLTLTCSDGDTYDIIREKGVNINVNAKAVVTKKSYDISTGSWISPSIISETISPTGGTYTKNFNNISDTTIFTFKAIDTEGLVGSSSKQIDFVDPIYVCYIDKTTDIVDVTEGMVKGGTKVLKKKGTITEDIISANQKVGFCFPKSYGLLTSLKDVKNSFENLDSFDIKEIDITSVDGRTVRYYLYLNSLAVTLDASDKFQYQLKW